ncbi:MAG: hypothetical protein JST85_02520 [Acidobacteria bacterium]|nr:hypothetical protein [Acidobacteriota bacterium]
MTKRPLSITLISWIFIGFGAVTFVASLLSLTGLAGQRTAEFPMELWLVPVIRLFAIVSGILMLRGLGWGRWLLIVWMAYHIVLSLFHSPFELIVHSLLFAVVLYFLFRPQAVAYFANA